MSENGKGDAPRPLSIPRKQYESNWDHIFGVPSELPDTLGPDIRGMTSDELDAYIKRVKENLHFPENSENS